LICNTNNIDTIGATEDLYGATTGAKKKYSKKSINPAKLSS